MHFWAMRKYTVLLLVLCGTFTKAEAQALISTAQWKILIDCLNEEKWQQAATLSNAYLLKVPKTRIDEDAPAILRYMYITSEAGLMNSKQLTKEKAFKNVAGFAGHNIILPAHPIALKTAFNSIELVNDKTDTLEVTAANKIATDIFSFEYIIPERPYSLDEFKRNKDKMCRIGGRLKSIKTEGLSFPRFRIVIDRAELHFDE
jgi:hypothetical protein